MNQVQSVITTVKKAIRTTIYYKKKKLLKGVRITNYKIRFSINFTKIQKVILDYNSIIKGTNSSASYTLIYSNQWSTLRQLTLVWNYSLFQTVNFHTLNSLMNTYILYHPSTIIPISTSLIKIKALPKLWQFSLSKNALVMLAIIIVSFFHIFYL